MSIRPDPSTISDISGLIIQVEPNKFVIKKKILTKLPEIDICFIHARFIPNFLRMSNERTIDGFRIYRIEPSSIFECLGLKNGDVIKSINGEGLDSLEELQLILLPLFNVKNFIIEIERKKTRFKSYYKFE